jgi:TonB family protein
MSRLYQKSVIASSGVHVLLALILVVCPAFLTPKPKVSDVQPITFIPDILIDRPFANPGGSPGSLPPAPKPAPPVVRPSPPLPEVRPAPPREQPKETPKETTPPKTESDSLEVGKETTRKKPEFTLTPKVRKSITKSTTKDTSTTDTEDRQQYERNQRLMNQLDRTLGNIKSGTGSATRIEEGYGSGNTGPSYAPYSSWVLTVFDNAWVAPEDASSEDSTVEVSVTIASDGSIIAKRIVKRSGDSAVDASVQRALDKVTTMGRPFPEGAKDKQRSYIIPFNMKTRRGTA